MMSTRKMALAVLKESITGGFGLAKTLIKGTTTYQIKEILDSACMPSSETLSTKSVSSLRRAFQFSERRGKRRVFLVEYKKTTFKENSYGLYHVDALSVRRHRPRNHSHHLIVCASCKRCLIVGEVKANALHWPLFLVMWCSQN